MSNSRSPRAVCSITIGISCMSITLGDDARGLRDHDRGALEAAGAQIGQRLLRLIEAVGRDGRPDRHLGSEFEQLVAVLTRQVGYRPDRALLPQIGVRK